MTDKKKVEYLEAVIKTARWYLQDVDVNPVTLLPRENISKKMCYRTLLNLLNLFDSNGFVSDDEFIESLYKKPKATKVIDDFNKRAEQRYKEHQERTEAEFRRRWAEGEEFIARLLGEDKDIEE